MKKLKLFSFITALISLGLIVTMMPKNIVTERVEALDENVLPTSLDFTQTNECTSISEEYMTDSDYYEDPNTGWTYFGGVTNMSGDTQLEYLKFGAKDNTNERKTISMLGPYADITVASQVDVYFAPHALADGMEVVESQIYIEVYKLSGTTVYLLSRAIWDRKEGTLETGLHLTYHGHDYDYKWHGDNLRFGLRCTVKNNSNEDGVFHLKKFLISNTSGANVTDFRIWDYGINAYPGDEFDLRYNIYPSDAVNKTIFWTVDNESMLTVDSNGHVKVNYGMSGQCWITGTTEDGGKTAKCWVKILDEVTTISDAKFRSSSYGGENKYKINAVVSGIVHYNDAEYVLLNDNTGSLVVTNESGIELQEGATYSVDIAMPSIPIFKMYVGLGRYFEKLMGGSAYTPASPITNYGDIVEENKAQIVDISCCKVTELQSDTSYAPLLYRLGDKYIYAHHSKVLDPIANNYYSCPLFSKGLQLRGLLVPYHQASSSYRLVLIPDDTYKLATVKVNYYLQEFDASEYELYQSKDFVVGEKIDSPEVTVTNIQKVLGWSTDKENWSQFDFEAFVTQDVIDLYANVVEKSNVTATFMVNGEVYFEENGKEGYKVIEPIPPKLAGQIFVGWATSQGASASDVDFSEPIVIDSSVIYYAVFRDPNDITVTLMNGETVHETFLLKEGQNLVNVPYTHPNKTGKVFESWFLDQACTKRYVRTDELYTNTTLYAGFRDYMDCTVTFRFSDGRIISETTVIEGQKIPNEDVPSLGTLDGKKYNGWVLVEGDLIRKVELSTFVVQNSCDLIAVEERTGLFIQESVRTQLYLKYIESYDEHGSASYSLDKASIHIGFRMTYIDYLLSNPTNDKICLFYGTDQTFASADNRYKLSFNTFDDRLKKIHQSLGNSLTPQISGLYGYEDLGFKGIVGVTPMRVDESGNANEKGDYIQFGVTINNVTLASLDTRIYVAAYCHTNGYGCRFTYNSPIGESFREICQRYLTHPNKNELFGDHLGVLSYLANYRGA